MSAGRRLPDGAVLGRGSAASVAEPRARVSCARGERGGEEGVVGP